MRPIDKGENIMVYLDEIRGDKRIVFFGTVDMGILGGYCVNIYRRDGDNWKCSTRRTFGYSDRAETYAREAFADEVNRAEDAELTRKMVDSGLL
jgi:hypothetical protein